MVWFLNFPFVHGAQFRGDCMGFVRRALACFRAEKLNDATFGMDGSF